MNGCWRMSDMSDTPRTDKAKFYQHSEASEMVVDVDFAGELERES